MNTMQNTQVDIQERIKKIIQDNKVVVFMKGTSTEPQCGFSFTVVKIFNYLGVEFFDVNVLADQEIREGVKIFSDWPTVPQVYICGEFIGGCDIMKEIFETKELHAKLDEHGIAYKSGNE